MQQDGTCAHKGYFELVHTRTSGDRFGNLLDDSYTLHHTVQPEQVSNTTPEQFAGRCMCVCLSIPECMGAAVRSTLSLHQCVLLSETGGSVHTELDVQSYSRALPRLVPCGAASGANPESLINLLNTYLSPVPDLEWSSTLTPSAIISRTTETGIPSHMLLEAKIACLNRCCAVPLCQAVFIEQAAGAAACSLLTNRGVPVSAIEGDRRSLMYRRQEAVSDAPSTSTNDREPNRPE